MRVSSAQIGLLGLALVGQINASPVNLITELECLAVEVVAKALAGCSTATPFCSSFLGISTVTKTATVVSSATTTLMTTKTTGTSTITVGTVTSTETETASVTTCILSAVEKRDINPRMAIPAALSKYANSQITSACECLGLPTPTTTTTTTVKATQTATSIINVAASTDVTATVTVTVTTTSTDISCPTPSQCGNQGLQFAEYTNDQGDNDDSDYSQFDPTVYKTETPNFSGVTSTAGGIDASGGENITVYGTSYEFDSDYFVLDHRGYLFAAITGTYTITVSSVDDASFFWLGSDAYSGWTRDNADASIIYYDGPGSGSATVDLEEGDYLPIRIMFAQAQGNAIFQVSIQDPDGTVFLSSSTEDSPYLIQYSCDGTTAPEYPAWGQES